MRGDVAVICADEAHALNDADLARKIPRDLILS